VVRKRRRRTTTTTTKGPYQNAGVGVLISTSLMKKMAVVRVLGRHTAMDVLQ
jgi:hypothetical protein